MNVSASTALPCTRLHLALPLACLLLTGYANASSELEQRLERCALLGDASARLTCYDGLTKAPLQAVGSDVAALPADLTQPPPPATAAIGAAPVCHLGDPGTCGKHLADGAVVGTG